MLKLFFIILAALIVLLLGWGFLRSYLYYRKTVALEEKTTAFSRTVPGATMRILVLGDSTAVGTGAEDPSLSTAGRLAALYPQADIVNLSQNGLKISGLLKILATLQSTSTLQDQHFDLVLIQIGANDIIRLTSLQDIDSGISQVLGRAQAFGGKILLLHSGNIGDALFFPWYVRPILSRRSFEVRDIYEKESAAYGATYIDLIDSDADKTIEANLRQYYADDFLHLNGAGYGLWFDEISPNLPASKK